MIPLISTLCRGPLNVGQLPRFWWKVLNHQAGLLDASYPYCSAGLDTYVLQTLQLDRDTTIAYLRDQMPTYLEFEDWVLAQKGGALHQPTVERWNNCLLARTHIDPAKIDETYDDIGYSRDITIGSAVVLNCLQDWTLFHRHDLTGQSSPKSVPPLLSSTDQGPLGICQLPRTWLKTSLRARDLLHEDYPDCADGSLDQRCMRALGIDQEQTLTYLRDNLPTYLEFEDWVRQQAGPIDQEAVAEFNCTLLERQHIPAKLADIHATLDRPNNGTWTGGVLLNHLEDWQYAHNWLMQQSN
ncbi:MAG: hypothetical protein GKR89_34875 [Candidatus Latescibacteria bacterium]|nr:hypothetical protein [Candidatus Latescibacterota bacterium]